MKKDVLIYFGGKIIPTLVNLAIIILAVRYLGKAEYGKYSLVFYATMLLSTLTFGWIQQSILRFLSVYPNEQVLVVNRFFFLTLLSSLSAAVVGLFLCVFYFHLPWSDTIVVVIYIFMYQIFLFHLTLNQTNKKSLNYAVLEGSYYLVFLIFFLLLIFVFNQNLFIVLFIAMVIGLVVTELMRIMVLPGGKAGLDPTRIYFETGFSKTVFSFGFPITIWLFLSYLVNISDRFILKEFASYENVGTYAAIKDLIIKISTFTTIPILLAYHPKIMETWNHHEKKGSLALVKESLLLVFLVSVSVIIFFLFAQDYLYQRVLKLNNPGLGWTTFALLLSAFLYQAAMLIHKPLELLLKQNLMIIAIIGSLIFNIAGNLIFVPGFGFKAAAWVSLASSLFYIILVFIFSTWHLKKEKING
jgi:O-antigen/teichoic acid export membrane protein